MGLRQLLKGLAITAAVGAALVGTAPPSGAQPAIGNSAATFVGEGGDYVVGDQVLSFRR